MCYLKYLSYVLRHKWFVLLACVRRGLIIRGITHDLSKFSPREFFPYAKFFYKKQVRDKTGYYKPTDTGDAAFEYAWLSHARANDHHWQYWVLATEDGNKVYEMSDNARLEMLCDWIGAGKAQKTTGGPGAWYNSNKDKLILGPETRSWIEKELIRL